MGYSGISGSFPCIMPGKNNQWEDVDNQGGRWVEKERNGAKVSERSIFKIRPFNKTIQFKICFLIYKK